VVKTPSQILDDTRISIAVIVASGNTSVKPGAGIFVRYTGWWSGHVDKGILPAGA
jgi:hypothetical protein